jgi:hypothetical protein
MNEWFHFNLLAILPRSQHLQHRMANGSVVAELDKDFGEAVVTQTRPYRGIKWLSKTMKTVSLDNQCQGRDSKEAPPAYKFKECITTPVYV